MKRDELPEQFVHLLKSARRVAELMEAEALLLLPERVYDFTEIKKTLRRKVRLLVASDREAIEDAVREDDVDFVKLVAEPQNRQTQLSQALLEGIAANLLKSGDSVVALYPVFERDTIDSMTVVNLSEHLAKLTSRDLQRLQTKVPLETLRNIVDLAVEIGMEGREGKAVGALFVVGDHQRVMELSHEGVHDPFRGYTETECLIRDPRVRESIKEIAQIDGAFVISSKGTAKAAGRILDAQTGGLTLSQGLGARHWAAAAISKATEAVAIAVSESSGTVRIFQQGMVVLRIEPMERGMKWHDVETEPPKPLIAEE